MASYPAIILAGGLGTRLRGAVSDLPKSMAPVNGKPFLYYIFLYLQRQNIDKAVLAVGYKYEAIKNFFGDKYLGIALEYSIEKEPLGTGGAIKKAFEQVSGHTFVLNGDTLFEIDLGELKNFHFETASEISLALKPMKNFDRYGTVKLQGRRITNFEEKKYLNEGLINGGIYFFDKKVVAEIAEEKFSFEKDVLEKFVRVKQINGKEFDNYFIDIGIPEDYQKVQEDFKSKLT